MVRLVLLVLVLLMMLPPELQVMRYPVRAPPCSRGSGGVQERKIPRDDAEMVKLPGGPLGTEVSDTINQKIHKVSLLISNTPPEEKVLPMIFLASTR